MRASSNEDYLIALSELVDQQEIAPNMAFPVVRPLTAQRMIVVFRRQSALICDEQHHRVFEAPEIEAP